MKVCKIPHSKSGVDHYFGFSEYRSVKKWNIQQPIEIMHANGLGFEIFTATGQKAGIGKASGNTINVHHLEKGIYFIHLKDKKNSTRLKFIKK